MAKTPEFALLVKNQKRSKIRARPRGAAFSPARHCSFLPIPPTPNHRPLQTGDATDFPEFRVRFPELLVPSALSPHRALPMRAGPDANVSAF
jgi:hypothetical protein